MGIQSKSQNQLYKQMDVLKQRISELEAENVTLREELHLGEQRLQLVAKNTLTTLADNDLNLEVVKIYNPHPDFEKGFVGTYPDPHLDPNFQEIDLLKREIIKTGAGHRKEVVLSLSDGIFTYNVAAEPLKSLSGKTVGIVVVATDITERKQVEQYLLEAEKLSMVGELSASVSHEIKNILAVIMASAQLIMKKMNKDSSISYKSILPWINTITEQGKKGTNVISNILDIARGGDSRKRLVDIREIIDRVLELQKNQLQLEHITIVKDYADIPKIKVNPEMIEQVFLNLSINARHAMKGYGSGTITISVREENHHVEIQFTDTGIGIKDGIKDKIFSPFFTTKSTYSGNVKKVKGSGLGLSIISQTIKSHSGTINVESKEGEGASFIIRLPLG